MTDGKTTAYERELSQENDWGHNLGSKTGFEHLAHVCEKTKSDEIEIYILQIEGNPHVTPYLQDCASSSETYFTVANSAGISTAFDNILGKLEADLRIVR